MYNYIYIHIHIYNLQKTVYIDLMMSVNPKVPPYSIFALHRFLKDTDVVISQDCNLPINSHKVLPYPVNSPSDKNNVINLMLTWSEGKLIYIYKDLFYNLSLKN